MKTQLLILLCGYRSPKQATRPQSGFKTTQTGGTAQEKFNALTALKASINQSKMKEYGL